MELLIGPLIIFLFLYWFVFVKPVQDIEEEDRKQKKANALKNDFRIEERDRKIKDGELDQWGRPWLRKTPSPPISETKSKTDSKPEKPSWEWKPKPNLIIMQSHVDEYYRSSEWQAKRSIMLARAENKCNRCGALQLSGLHVHHNNYHNFGNEKMTDLEVLCKTCHEKQHKRKFD